MSVVALSGNPRAGSRTLLVAQTLARTLADRLDLGEVASLDLAAVAPELFAAVAPEADRYAATLAAASVAVVATPVYKAAYTGLLKAFLDRYPSGGLRGVLAVPVVVSGSPAHSFVAEHLLRPLLVELGASAPTGVFAITEGRLGELDDLAASWADEAAPVVSALLPARVGAAR